MLKKISIIIPIYNTEKYLEKCINSVLDQNYTNIEVLLINDGSTDNSGVICDVYAKKDPRICVFHSNNMGVNNARNIGINNAQGDYLTFLDSDDYFSNRNALLDILCSSNNEDIIITNLNYVYGNNIEIFEQKKIKSPTSSDIIKAMLLDEISLALHGRFYKKQLFDNISLDKKYKIGEDAILNFLLLDKVKSILLVDNISFYFYLQRNDSVSHSPSDEALKSIPLFIFFINQHFSIFRDRNFQGALDYCILSRFFNFFLLGGSCENDKKLLNIIRKSIFSFNLKTIKYSFFLIPSLQSKKLGSIIRKILRNILFRS